MTSVQTLAAPAGHPAGAALARIDHPGVYDIPADEYHADPVPGGSLSSSGARLLLPPSCPAKYRHVVDHGQAPRAVFDLGHAAHRLVLGAGPELVRIDADNWRTKRAQTERDDAHAAGAVPLLTAEHDQAHAMAEALRTHPVAAALFHPDSGAAEQSLFWVDGEFGVWRRARLDWLPHLVDGRRLILADYKTTKSADPAYLSRALHDYGYYQQAPWYTDAVTALGLAGSHEPAFVLVCQEKEPPYVVTIAQPDPMAVLWGQRRNRKALDIYRQCQETGLWPGFSDAVIPLGLPGYAEYQHQAAFERGDYDIKESA